MLFVVVVRTHHAPFCGHRLPAMAWTWEIIFIHLFVFVMFLFWQFEPQTIKGAERIVVGKKVKWNDQ